RIFSGDGIQVLNRDDPRSLAMALPGRKTISFGLDIPRRAQDWGLLERGGERWLAQGANTLLAVRELKLAGLHNAANALAALALCAGARAHRPRRAADRSGGRGGGRSDTTRRLHGRGSGAR